jgi:hypothetical protein
LSSTAERVVIGMDPHKRSATIEVMTGDETIVGGGRFGTDRDSYDAMLAHGRQWPDRVSGHAVSPGSVPVLVEQTERLVRHQQSQSTTAAAVQDWFKLPSGSPVKGW